jgi:Fe-Mn family superoxide dismutase
VDKRTFIKSVLLAATGVFAMGFTSKTKATKKKKKWNGIFTLPALPYSYDALEPFIDAETMELHYTKHHASYAEKFNAAVKETGLTGKTAREIIKEVSKYPAFVRNNGGGYQNHNMFWKMLTPPKGQQPSTELSNAISKEFGSLDIFREEFSSAAKAVFGSGWVWLIADSDKLKIITTADQDNPIMDIANEKGFPILCLDVWEHAYYLKNQNKRVDYINAFWNVVNWEYVSKRYSLYRSNKIKV